MSALTDRLRAWAWPRPRAVALLGGATARTRVLVAACGVALAAVAVAACLLAGLSPLLPFALAFLVVVALRPVPALAYAMVVFGAPLGLRMLGVHAVFTTAFGGRDYILNLSAAAVVFVRAALAVYRARPWRLTRRRLALLGVAGLVVSASALVGFAHHGVTQTVIGVRYLIFPLVALLALAALPVRDLVRLIGLQSCLVIANAVAAIAEFAIGPARLAAWGLDDGQAIRYIDGNFRAPGLTEFNAQLGMLGGAYLLGYLALWLARLGPAGPAGARRWLWHAGAGAAAVCLALSTSRSGAVLVAGGVIAAAVLNRAGGAAGRRRSRLLGLGVLVVLAAGFAAVGATGSSSLFQRFDVWSTVLDRKVPLYGLGAGAAGAATNSRFASGSQVFVDNYYVSLALQLGPVVLVALVAAVIALLAWLSRHSADRPAYALHIAVIAGLLCTFLVIEGWEYDSAMVCLALFVAYGLRRAPDERAATKRAPAQLGGEGPD